MLGDGDEGLSWPFDREFFKSLVSFAKRDLTRAWNFESNFSTLGKDEASHTKITPCLTSNEKTWIY